ncbi:hypothetical protein TRVL_05740 [Trypanosoma vivax]|uniref:Uncharacterized protein n=1 Tax=Trypanosoma vivax (strain Y486) TaxID=1055687 RepID=G0U610_TRYVY|nr:hypothetical protein TRVL_05740 [Trypanosoma vivax]CCC51311.1 hypothetical protein, unlikely [Trypanosoma vivax Y486]
MQRPQRPAVRHIFLKHKVPSVRLRVRHNHFHGERHILHSDSAQSPHSIPPLSSNFQKHKSTHQLPRHRHASEGRKTISKNFPSVSLKVRAFPSFSRRLRPPWRTFENSRFGHKASISRCREYVRKRAVLRSRVPKGYISARKK